MKLRMLLLVLGMTCVARAGADSDPLQEGLVRLGSAVDELGMPGAGEVASERAELAATLSRLQRNAGSVGVKRGRVDAEQDTLDRLNREREDRIKQVDWDQKLYDTDMSEFMRREQAIRAEAASQRAAVAAADTDEAMASANAWGDDGNRRLASMKLEAGVLDQRKAALDDRRDAIAEELSGHMVRAKRLARFRAEVDSEAAKVLAECSTALSRALAVRQIANSPARAGRYESPGALGDTVLVDIFSGLAKEGALKAMEGKTMVGLLSKVGLKAHPIGVAYTVLDTALDVTTVGVDQRTKEVTRNLFLIGDYGAVMKAMIKEQGPDATQTPEYLAMREELQRISADMPKSKADMMLQGLNSTAALGAALTAAAGNYLSKPVGRAGASVTNHLNNIERATLGRGGVKFFTNAFEALGSVAGDVIVKTSAGAITEQTRDVQQARSSQ